MAATRHLWFGRTTEFPAIPVLRFLCGVPLFVDTMLSSAVIGGLLFLALCPDGVRSGILWRRRATWAALAGSNIALGGLFLLNQHRLQAWAWFLFLCLLAVAAQRPARLLRWLVAGVYLYSGLSKLSTDFLSGGGRWLLDGFLLPFGESTSTWSASGLSSALWLLPLGEIFAAVCLLLPQARKLRLSLMVMLHAALLVALGPWGLKHQPAVLIWNMQFLAFAPVVSRTVRQHAAATPRACRVIAAFTLVCGLGLPCLGWWNLDPWMAWRLYSSPRETMRLFVRSDEAGRLPMSAHRHLQPLRPFENRRLLRLDRWALAELSAPLHPTNRFRAAVIAALGREHELVHLSAEVETPAETLTLTGRARLQEYADSFRFNTKPRRP